MTNTISVPRELKPCPFCGGEPNLTTADYVHDDLTPMPVVECKSCSAWVQADDWNTRAPSPAGVDGLEVIGFHCMDSAGIETLEWRGGSYADEPLCSLPKAQAIIDRQAARIAELQQDADRYRWLRHMTTKERAYIVQQEYDKVMDMLLDESMKGMKGGRNE